MPGTGYSYRDGAGWCRQGRPGHGNNLSTRYHSLNDAARESLGAAEEYAKTKCRRGDMERRCREIGVVFQPMIFESTGGVSAEAERVIKCLNKAVAANSDSTEVVVATRFWQRIGIDLLRGNCRSFHRRVDNDRGELGASGLGLYFQTLSGLTMPATA